MILISCTKKCNKRTLDLLLLHKKTGRKEQNRKLAWTTTVEKNKVTV